MAAPDPLVRIPALYHFTDTRNLAQIRAFGAILSVEKLKEKGVKEFYPGGNDISLEADAKAGMDKYVHLCFLPNHPMEFLAREAGRIVKSIFLDIDPAILYEPNVMFSNGVSNKTGMTFQTVDEARTESAGVILGHTTPRKRRGAAEGK
jgi:ssDNA thymidine ADP-ribosyltransferase, DarT